MKNTLKIKREKPLFLLKTVINQLRLRKYVVASQKYKNKRVLKKNIREKCDRSLIHYFIWKRHLYPDKGKITSEAERIVRAKLYTYLFYNFVSRKKNGFGGSRRVVVGSYFFI